VATARSRKAKTLKALRHSSSSTSGQETEVERLTRERDEALEREKASAGVLRIISTSPGELKPIFQAMLENAVRICEAVFGNLYLRDADGFHMVAAHHDSPAFVAARMSEPLLRPPPDAPLGRLAITKAVVQVADIRTLPSRDHPFVAPGVKAGYRTVLAIPLLKHDELIGAFTLIRQKVQTFTEKQIALVQNFAAQAVIAIENTRLLNELQQRTADLGESLEQQTATADVLRVISSSPGELAPVFQSMLEAATRICEAKSGNLYGFDGKAFYLRADLGTPPAFAEFARQPRIWGQDTALGQITRTKQTVHIVDALADRATPTRTLGG
jgi:transcriptional regulator with GAF, ATPase, and Fis domain